MKLFPRHEIDIEFSDLSAGLLSYLFFKERSKFEKNIRSIWSRKHVRVSFTVRTAFDSLLTTLNFPPGSEVLMSAINIGDMVSIVEANGLNVSAVDIDANTASITEYNLANAISYKSKVLVVAQLFGVIIDLEAISRICEKNNIFLIEDCAQAYCGSRYFGSPFADVSLFSFGPIKSSTALGGAVVAARSEALLANIDLLENGYPNRGDYWFFKRIIKYTAIKIVLIPHIYGLFVRLLSFFGRDLEKTINSLSRSFPKGNVTKNIRYKPPVRLLFLLSRRLSNVDNSRFLLRESVARNLLFKLDGEILSPGGSSSNNSFWIVPVVSNNPNKLQKELYCQGFDSTRGSHSQVAVSNNITAESLLENVVYLPSLLRMNDIEKEKIVSVLINEKTNC